MTVREGNEERSSAALRVVLAMLLGMLGAVFIWWATAYNNHLFMLGGLADSYLPIGALFLVFLSAVVINPILRRLFPRGVLSRAQLVVMVSIWLMASVLPGQGLFRFLPFMLAQCPVEVSAQKDLAKMHEKMDLPPSLFPEKLEYGARVDHALQYMQQLPEGESIPWDAWVGPLLTWGIFFLFVWMFMVGLSMIVFPQWRDNERLPFPLLSVYEAQLDEPEPGRFLPRLFRQRGFWIGAGIVLVLHLLSGLNRYFPSHVPCIPLEWDLRSAATNTVLYHLPKEILLWSRLYFVFIGIGFLMPTRISFSIWFTTVAYGIGRVVRTVYLPPYYEEAIEDHRTGAVFAITLFILWTGRLHWLRVLRSMLGRGRNEDDVRFGRAGWFFVIGCVGAGAWLVWAGVQWPWAIVFVLLGVVATLIMSRLVAETGLPFFRLHRSATPDGLLLFTPANWLTFGTVFFSVILRAIFFLGSRVQPAVMATHALGLERRRPGQAPGMHRGLLLLGTLLAGFVICGAIMVHLGYRHGAPLNASPPLGGFGASYLTKAHTTMRAFDRDNMDPSSRYSQGREILIGAGLAGGLQWACLNVPKWPLHPVGMLLVRNYYGQKAFTSIFIGWLLKVLILRLGGGRSFRKAQPLFMGLILGEVIAAIGWAIVSGTLAAMGLPFENVMVQPG